MWLYFGVYLKWEIQVPESTSPLGPLGPTGTPTGPTGEMAPMPSETTTWGPGYPSKISGTSPAVHWKCIQMLGQSFTDQTKILKNIYISFPPYQTWTENYGKPKKSLVHQQHHHHNLISSPLK